MNENIIHAIIATISALGSVGAWRFYELKLKYKADKELSPQKANELFIQDLQGRVSKLEALLIESSEEKDRLRNDIIKLSSEVATLKEKSKHLDKENTYLKGQRRARKK
tara:strand:+ start:1025 stop:1351 length:327 start_codon:yes stop_codon:yes gene_type:complete